MQKAKITDVRIRLPDEGEDQSKNLVDVNFDLHSKRTYRAVVEVEHMHGVVIGTKLVEFWRDEQPFTHKIMENETKKAIRVVAARSMTKWMEEALNANYSLMM